MVWPGCAGTVPGAVAGGWVAVGDCTTGGLEPVAELAFRGEGGKFSLVGGDAGSEELVRDPWGGDVCELAGG